MKEFTKVLASIFLFTITCSVAWAQQPGQYSMYMIDPVRWNPAYAGMEESLHITGTFRRQWSGLEGAPTSQRITAHLPLEFLRSGFGIQAENDELGARQLQSFRFDYNFRLPLGGGILAIGGNASLAQLTLNGNELRTPEGDYPENIIIHNDALLPDAPIQASVTSFGVGMYFRSETVEIGLSVDNLQEPTAEFDLISWQLLRAIYGGARLNLPIGSNLLVQPSVWARTDAIETQTDFSILLQYNDNIFGGASFRGYSQNTADAVALIAGFNLSPKLRLAYAYDVPLSQLRSVHNGSHEISVSYNLRTRIGAGVPPPIIYHPRSR